jgi:hypothetical protein
VRAVGCVQLPEADGDVLVLRIEPLLQFGETTAAAIESVSGLRWPVE